MAKSETVRARIEPKTKMAAEEIFQALGLNSTEAITLFYKQVVFHRGLPFPVKIPNEETLEAMQQARTNVELTDWADLDALKADH